ncbi:unnamed protein product [Ophioblennius macclurei]
MGDRPEPQPEPELPGDVVGRRVSCSGERATVRYVGPVGTTAGVWLGVEWDDPQRGKHDGSHEGVQYFSCRHPKGGSFVRPAKASYGVEYLTAVRQVYPEESDTFFNTKDRSLQSRTSVLLGGLEVNGPGSEEAIRRTTPNVQVLDLTRSLLLSWEDVSVISGQMDQLNQLMLSCNRLSLPPDPPALSHAFCNLKILHLHKCELTWPQVLHCAPMWPQLESLVVAENNISDVQRPEGVLQSLVSLHLELNPLAPDAVLGLSALPRLEELNVSHTGLSTIQFEDAAPGCQTAMFPKLKTLIVDDNNITEWRVIDEFAKLPSLVRLSCRRNPLQSSDGNPATAHQMVMAKLGRLLVLNASEVLPEERRGAELDYIKMFGMEWLKTKGCSESRAQFDQEHPRYQILIDKYGAPEEGELKKPVPFALKNQILKITFAFPNDDSRKPIEKKLPASILVQNVKGLLHKLLKVPAADLRLTYSTSKEVGTEFEVDGDLKPLQFYSIKDGDQILVRWS